MNTSTNLLTLEAGGGCEILDSEELFEAASGLEKNQTEKIVIISGTITVSP